MTLDQTNLLRALTTRTIALLFLCPTVLAAQQESDYYVLEKVTIPEDIALEVGGMDFLPDGRLAVCTRTGEVWLIDDLDGTPTYVRFARGLHEPLGLTAHDGSVYVSQRGEVTRLTDSDGDDRADRYETVYELPLTGNYHEYHYGPLVRPDGSMMTTLNVGWEGKGVSKAPWRGWMMRYDPAHDRLEPYATGLRSPAGFGVNPAGDLFVAENQGDWIGSGRITHLRAGDFAGHPAGLAWADQPDSPVELRPGDITNQYGTMYAAHRALGAQFKLPAVWFPHGILGISTAAILADDRAGAFGPFAGQLFVSDQGQSKIMRVALEQVDGEYQGAVFPFREGFSSGLLRLGFDGQDRLYAGQTARGWAATGGEEFALERLRWTGETPFEIHHVAARADGFDIAFTHPPGTRVRAQNFALTSFTYKYHSTYGSPAVDFADHPVTAAEVLPDGKTVRLTIDDMRPGYIYEIKVDDLRSDQGLGLLHNFGYYTLNRVPGGGTVATQAVETNAGAEAVPSSSKRVVAMPAAWDGEVDADLLIESALGMKFAQTTLSVKPGQRVRLTFRNPDDMQHNFVLTAGKKGDAVGRAADKLGLRGLGLDYVPDSDLVLAHTRLVEPETDDVIYFTAPTEPGVYEYVCTVPGHWRVMRGVLLVR